MVYGYIRVSTKDQKTFRQEEAFKEYQISRKNVFTDKQSGKDFSRPAYQKLIRKLKEGDLVVVKSIDRLGRNYEEILEQWRIVTKEKKADIVVIDMPLLDTRKNNDLTGILIADIVLQLLSYVAQTERQFIRERQREGIAAAQKRGVQFGRPRIVKPHNYDEVYRQWNNQVISAREAGRSLNFLCFLTLFKTIIIQDRYHHRYLREMWLARIMHLTGQIKHA